MWTVCVGGAPVSQYLKPIGTTENNVIITKAPLNTWLSNCLAIGDFNLTLAEADILGER